MTSVVRAGSLQGFEEVVLALGGDPAAMLSGHGIGPIDDPERPVPLDAAAEMFEHCAAALDAPDFGLRVGISQGPVVLGAVATVARPGRSIAQVFTDVSRFLFLHSPAYDVALETSSPVSIDGETLRFSIELRDSTPTRQFVDGCLASASRAVGALTSGNSGLQAVSVPHSPVSSARPYRTAFGVEVFFEQPYAGLHFAPGATTRRVDDLPALRSLADATRLAAVHGRARTVSDQVAGLLITTLGAGPRRRADVAAALELHPRTLQRRLAAEGTTFDRISDGVHRTAALRLLRETALPISQVAAILGYSEQSTLTRASRHWFGRTPSQMRSTAPMSVCGANCTNFHRACLQGVAVSWARLRR